MYMARSDNWSYIQTPKIIFKEIEKILEDKEFQRFGFFKPKDVSLVLCREFLKNPKGILDISSTLEQGSEIKLIDIVNDRIILQDSTGAKIIEIDEDKKLMCYNCDEPHDNKYIDFVSENKKLWPFFKKHSVKFVKPRDKNNIEQKKKLV